MFSPWVLQKIRDPTVCFLLLATKSAGDRPAVPFRPCLAKVAFNNGLEFSSMTCDAKGTVYPFSLHAKHSVRLLYMATGLKGADLEGNYQGLVHVAGLFIGQS